MFYFQKDVALLPDAPMAEAASQKFKEILRESGALLESIANSLPGTIYVFDFESMSTLYQNGGVSDFIGYAREEVLGMGSSMLPMLLHPDDREVLAQHFATIQASRGDEYFVVEYRMRHRDGHYVWFQSFDRVYLRDDAGIPLQIVGIALEFTNVKRLTEELRAARDEAERASKAKSLFLANVSHEIRTPMNAIMGYTELLAATDLSPRQREYLSIISRTEKEFMTILEDLLEVSRLESDELVLSPAPFSPREVIAATRELFAAAAAVREIRLETDLCDALPPLVVGDAARLQQVLGHLVSNGIKYTPAGEVRLGIDEARLSGSGSQRSATLRFFVKDTGVGISPGDEERIFEPFSKKKRTGQAGLPGAGLGLSICRRLLRYMGGDLRVESVVGTGSRFEFVLTFPLESSFLTENDTTPSVSEDGGRVKRVLVVEDDDVSRALLQEFLEEEGHVVSTADNGRAAVDLAREREFDIIFMDCQMPVLDGYGATQEMRRLEARSENRIAIVGVSAYAMASDRERALTAGMDDYITKPVDFERIQTALHKWTGS